MLGTSLLFWGAMTGRPFIGLVAALAVEARHWTRLRWEFDDEACDRAWQLTFISIAMAGVLIWLDGNRFTALPNLLSWVPPLLLPLQFVQSYGMRDSLPLGMFSLLAKSRRKRNRRLGLIEDTTYFNFGNVLFVITMVSATVGTKADTSLFLPGLVTLSGWALLATGRSRTGSLIPVLIMAGVLALAGQVALKRAERWIGNRSSETGDRFDPYFNSTLIGTKGSVQQSADILWRLKPEGSSPPPALLKTATFINFHYTNWRNQRSDFEELSSHVLGEDTYYFLQDKVDPEDLVKLPAFTLRGSISEKSPLPLPGDASSLRNFELDWVERNSYGTVRVFPKNPVINGTVFWKSSTNPEQSKRPSDDLRLPSSERDVIQAAVKKLHLKDAPDLQLKLAILRTWFQREFRYTRDLTIKQASSRQLTDANKPPTALAQFLTDVRAGHCEYFATAATLMLREAGVRARYAIGFAVMERDQKRGVFVIRGTHGHAWCSVWDEANGAWIDFDPTPPDWFATISGQPTLMQRFSDSVKRIREDFFIWRSHPTNQLTVSLFMGISALGLSGFILKRLWHSKRKIEAAIQSGDYTGPTVRTPLHALETPARRQLGPRPPGQPFAQWLLRLRPSLPDPPGLDEAIALHQRIRFDPAPPPQELRERLATLTRQIESALKRKQSHFGSGNGE